MCAFIRKNSWLRVRFHTVLELTYCPLPCCKNWPFPITFLQCAPLHLHWQLWSWSGSKAWAEGRVTHLLEHSWKASRGRAMGLSFQCWRGRRDNTWGHGSGVKPAALKARESVRRGGFKAWRLLCVFLRSDYSYAFIWKPHWKCHFCMYKRLPAVRLQKINKNNPNPATKLLYCYMNYQLSMNQGRMINHALHNIFQIKHPSQSKRCIPVGLEWEQRSVIKVAASPKVQKPPAICKGSFPICSQF